MSRPAILETTAVGAAYAAGLAVGFWKDIGELSAKWQLDKQWTPAMAPEARAVLASRWKKAVHKSMGWVGGGSGKEENGEKGESGKSAFAALPAWLPPFVTGAAIVALLLRR